MVRSVGIAFIYRFISFVFIQIIGLSLTKVRDNRSYDGDHYHYNLPMVAIKTNSDPIRTKGMKSTSTYVNDEIVLSLLENTNKILRTHNQKKFLKVIA